MTQTFPLALVTGAAHRLGRAFALALARQGYAILLHYNTSAAQALATADVKSVPWVCQCFWRKPI